MIKQLISYTDKEALIFQLTVGGLYKTQEDKENHMQSIVYKNKENELIENYGNDFHLTYQKDFDDRLEYKRIMIKIGVYKIVPVDPYATY